LKRLATLVLVLGISLVACGGSKSSSSDSAAKATTTTVAPLTKAEFIAKADPICAKASSQVDAQPEPKSANELVTLVKNIVGIIKPAIADLRALPAAAEDAAVFKEHFLDPNQAQLDAADRFLAAVPGANGDEAKITALAEKFDKETSDAQNASEAHDKALKDFGFSDCAKTNE